MPWNFFFPFLNFLDISDMNSKQNLKLGLLLMPDLWFPERTMESAQLHGWLTHSAGTQHWCTCKQGYKLQTWMEKLSSHYSTAPDYTLKTCRDVGDCFCSKQSSARLSCSPVLQKPWKRKWCWQEASGPYFSRGKVVRLYLHSTIRWPSGKNKSLAVGFTQKCP